MTDEKQSREEVDVPSKQSKIFPSLDENGHFHVEGDEKRISITEEMGVHKEWYKQAKEVTAENLPEFIRHLSEDYIHDYGTIVHAITAGAIASCWVVNNSPHGGITGFQAGAVMWEFIKNWMHYENEPMRLVNYKNMLYPQYGKKFQKVISKNTFKWLQEEAQKKIAANLDAAPRVIKHWESIVEGRVPFGYEIEED